MGVYKRRDRSGGSHFYIRFTDERGVKRNIKVGPVRRDAEEVLRQKQAEAARRRHLPHVDLGTELFRDFATEYGERVAHRYADGWRDDFKRIVRVWSECFGNRRLADITPDLVESYRSRRLKTVKPSTVNREVAVLRKLYNDALAWGRCAENPLRFVKQLKERNQRLRFLTREESQRLVEVATAHLKPFLIVALNTGARRGELLDLRWSDVNFEARTIGFGSTKAGCRRDLRMNAAVLATLQALPKENEYVFTVEGRRLRVLHHSFKTACKRAGITDFRLHDTRHTFASHAVMSGMDLRTLQQILGHKTLQMVLRYAHLNPLHAMKAIENVDLGRPDAVKESVTPFRKPLTARRRSGATTAAVATVLAHMPTITLAPVTYLRPANLRDAGLVRSGRSGASGVLGVARRVQP